MSAKNWERIEAIFGPASELPDGERGAYLDEHCGGDAELRRQVETLLRADRVADGFLEHDVLEHDVLEHDVLEHATPPSAPLAAGSRVGPYRILEPLGEGGMGAVFLAERDDGTFARRVAVKVLRRGTESARAVERMERERQILADLDHPGIARLLDGGTTDTGLPYVVMELVDGEPIDQACRRLELSPGARVDLMLAVCEAVTAAHRQLVVHRDLKPTNILVDTGGRPKLLDFGIAKLLASEDGEGSLGQTESWDRRLTPSYASPEQLRGERITVATDVYLLGVVLYELLTGELPFRFDGYSLVEVERTVTSRTPRKPSELTPGLDGDLDAIVLKALRGDPRERYGSVEELAEDLRRYRAGQPVLARKGSVRYLAVKFLRRYWLPIGTAALFVLLGAAFGISTAAQAHRIERTLGRLIAVEGFLVDLFELADPSVAQGREIRVREVLDKGERQLERVAEPGSRGLLHALFGRIALHLGQLEPARGHLESALRIYGEIGNDPFLELAEIRARSDLAMALIYLEEDSSRSEALARAALERGRIRLAGDVEGLLDLLNKLTTIYCLQGKWEEAEPLSAEARALAERGGGAEGVQHAVAFSMTALLLKNHAGEPAEAERLYGRALEIYRRLAGEVHPNVANILNQLGLISRDRGDLEAAARRLGEALDVQRGLYPAGHWEVGRSLYQLGMIHRRAGELDKAEERMSEALRIYEEDPDRGPAYGRTIFIRIHLAEIRTRLGRTAEALEALAAHPPESLPEGGRLRPLAARALGCALAASGRPAEARAPLGESLEALRALYGDASWETEQARICLEGLRAAPVTGS